MAERASKKPPRTNATFPSGSNSVVSTAGLHAAAASRAAVRLIQRLAIKGFIDALSVFKAVVIGSTALVEQSVMLLDATRH